MNKAKVIVKLVVFSVLNGRLKIFLPKKQLPFVFFDRRKSLDDNALTAFRSHVDLEYKYSYLEQLYTFSHLTKKEVEVAVVYFLLIPSFVIPQEKLSLFLDIKDINRSISEKEIIDYATQRLRWKLEYTNVVYSLLPEEFILSQLQRTYEAILERKLDKRNFRRKILSLGIIKSTGKKKRGEIARPALIYRFRKLAPAMVKVF